MSICYNGDILNVFRILIIIFEIIEIVLLEFILFSVYFKIKSSKKRGKIQKRKLKKYLLKKVVLASTIFLIPFLVKNVVIHFDTKEILTTCFKNANQKDIKKMYKKRANDLISIAVDSKELKDYNDALKAIDKLKGTNEKEKLRKTLENRFIEKVTSNNQEEINDNVNTEEIKKIEANENTNTILDTKIVNEEITQNDNIVTSKNTWEYNYDTNELMAYALYTPENITDEVPLIVWLHGSAEFGASKDAFLTSGLLKVVNEWSSYNLENINAYILAPHMTSGGSWNGSITNQKVINLINNIKSNYKINPEKIILVGHSMGGVGTTNIAAQNQELFSAIVPLSDYTYPSAAIFQNNIEYFKNIRIKGYSENVGTPSQSMYAYFNAIGKLEDYKVYNCIHGDVPKYAFTEDLNNDNISDLIEWMFL